MSPFDAQQVAANPGLLIGATFGTVFLLANSGAPVAAAAGATIKAIGVLCLLAVGWAQSAGTVAVGERPEFGRGFWLIVAAEVLVGAAGLLGLRLTSAPVQANVAWIALVVGAHFVALSVLWRDIGISVVGTVVAVAGVIGLALATASTAVTWIPAISGVVSGFALLVGSLATSVAARRRRLLVHPIAQPTGPVRR